MDGAGHNHGRVRVLPKLGMVVDGRLAVAFPATGMTRPYGCHPVNIPTYGISPDAYAFRGAVREHGVWHVLVCPLCV